MHTCHLEIKLTVFFLKPMITKLIVFKNNNTKINCEYLKTHGYQIDFS